MDITHKLILYLSLGFLAISLIIPGLIEMFKTFPNALPVPADTRNQLRALNGMMTGVGFMALWACLDIDHSRLLIVTLGGVLLLVVIARIYSCLVDGFPELVSWFYLGIEMLLAVLFLKWPPGN